MLPLLFFLIAFVSEVVGTVAGFGSSVFFVPLAGMLFGFHEVLAFTNILHVFSNAAKLVFFRQHVQWRLLLLLGIPAEAANKTPLAGWWIAHAGARFAGIAVAWSAAMMMLASLRLNRWEE